MADNLGITVGTDANVATDDCGAAGHIQRIKLDIGGNGASSPVVAGNGLPVAVESLPGTVATDITAIKTAVEVLDNAISGSEMQVDVVAALPAGANNIGSVNVADVVPGTGATNLGKAEDAAHTTGDVGVMALSVRTNTATARGGTDGDYQPLITDTNGRLHVITGPSTSTIEVVGDAAHDAAVAGNPVLVGGYASSTAPSNVSANGDVARAWYLLNGAQATALTAAGALIGGDASNGLDVDVTRLPSFPASTSTTAATFAQGVKTVAAAATPELLVGSTTLVETVTIQAKKGFNSANTSAVFVGFSGTNDSNYLELLPGDSVSLKAPQGKKLDLNLIYIECVTAGDGVSYTSVN